MSKPIEIRSKEAQGAEVSWFAPICDGDDRYLGERNVKYKSNWENSSNVLLNWVIEIFYVLPLIK